jgi:hypothetical protein
MADSRFVLKRVKFLNRRVAILLQNENGPCPLVNVFVVLYKLPKVEKCATFLQLAIANVLLLRGSIYIHEDVGSIDLEFLVAMIADLMISMIADQNSDPGQRHKKNKLEY